MITQAACLHVAISPLYCLLATKEPVFPALQRGLTLSPSIHSMVRTLLVHSATWAVGTVTPHLLSLLLLLLLCLLLLLPPLPPLLLW